MLSNKDVPFFYENKECTKEFELMASVQDFSEIVERLHPGSTLKIGDRFELEMINKPEENGKYYIKNIDYTHIYIRRL